MRNRTLDSIEYSARCHFKLTPSQLDSARRLALSRGLTVSQLLRDLIDKTSHEAFGGRHG